jgi:1-acyl-sn-glycerol-3-phosphate acyltransferase
MRDVLGAVDGTRRNVDLLMENKSAIFVYPGGARETFKRTTDKKYELIWGQRKGFAQMAIRHGCTIVPVTNFGTEDMLKVVGDMPLGWVPIPFLWKSDRTLPLMLPTSEAVKGRVYFLFGDPIRTDSPNIIGREEDDDVVNDIVMRTKEAIENGIEILREKSKDENEDSLNRSAPWGAIGQWVRQRAAMESSDETRAEKIENPPNVKALL